MNCMYHKGRLFGLFAVLLFTGFGQLAFTAEPPSACERKVLKASAQLSKCHLARRAKGLETEKCETRFQRAYDRAVARFGDTNCPGDPGNLLGKELDDFILDQTSEYVATVSAAAAGTLLPTTMLQIVNNAPQEYGNSSIFGGQLMQQSISIFVPTQDGIAAGCPNPSAGCKIDPQDSLTWSMTNTTNSVVGIQWNLVRYDSSHGARNTCDNGCQQQVIDVANCTSTYHVPGTIGPSGVIPAGDCSTNVAGPNTFDPAPYWQATIATQKQGDKCIINITGGHIFGTGATTHLCSCDEGQYPCNSSNPIWHDCSTEPSGQAGPGCP